MRYSINVMAQSSLFYKMPDVLTRQLKILEKKPPGDPSNWSDQELIFAAARVLKMPILALNSSMVDIEAYRKSSPKLCERLKVAPLFTYGTMFVFAACTPWEPSLVAELRQVLHAEIVLVACSEEHMLITLSHLKSIEQATPQAPERAIELTHVTETGWNLGKVEGSQETDLVKNIIRKAFAVGASDIHVEPYEHQLDIRFRVHGVMVVMPPIEKRYMQKAIDDFKLLAMMKVSDRNSLKDGRISIPVTTMRSLDLRVAAAPTLFGETMVMRLLDPESLRRNLGMLPFEGDGLNLARFALSRPNGLIIVTGPTGSGKTTTLYRCLTSLNLSKQKVITVEDPIEYTLNGISQIQVDTENSLTFANALRSILRMDPEVIMIGEIRDPETANLAIQASLTGHLVLTTLHTNDSVGVIPRLVDLKVTPQLIISSLLLVIAQRLLGKLCANCKESTDLNALKIRHFEKYRIKAPELTYLQNPIGCEACYFAGITGMLPIFEFLHCNSDMRHSIALGAPEKELRSLCNQAGNPPLVHHALTLASKGLVSYEEAEIFETELSSW